MAGAVWRFAAGALAGTAGTLAMDLVWYSRFRRAGGEDGFADWEFATGSGSFEEASAPAKFAERVTSAIGVDLPERSAGVTTNLVHWLTGAGYGAVAAVVLPARRDATVSGLLTGTGAWLSSYAVLGLLGLYRPIWDYDADTLLEDLTAHLTFGIATALTTRLLAGPTGAS